jgi:prepilin-type N-terminal cleavage/methylation domain-containing protein
MKSNIFFYFRKEKLEKGFTIIELLIAIVIIGVLAGISVPSAFKWVEKEKQNSYIRELISYLELLKKETRRWNGSCSLQTNNFSNNSYDPVTRKTIAEKAFIVNCKGMDNSQKLRIARQVPRIEKNVFQEVSQQSFNFTPKGHLSIPNNQTSLVIIIGGKPSGGFYQRPKCISMDAPIGMIKSGVYQSNYYFYSNRPGSRRNSGLRKRLCYDL